MKFTRKNKLLAAAILGASLFQAAPLALADINVGVVLSLTGPGASMGMPENAAVKLWPNTIAGEKVNLFVLNDSTDPTMAAKSASKLIVENKVDVIIGASLTPPTLAMLEVAAQNKMPVISLAGGGVIVAPVDGPRTWAFKVSPPEKYSVSRIIAHMQQNKLKTVAAIAIATSYGEGFLKELHRQAEAAGIKVTEVERYNQTDQSVTAQIIKMTATHPDAVFIISAGTPGALPQIELKRRGYKGNVYQTQGIANNDFLRVGGKDLDGAYVTVAPVLVAEQLPDSNPVKKPAMAFVQKFESKYGPNSRSLFAASGWDAYLLLEKAATEAVKNAQPGTPAFRTALRDQLEQLKDVMTGEGVFNFSASDHNGVDERCQVLVRIEDGKWKLVK
jgi:branched-chain amino acid transport system substrate-binding protein